MIKRALVLVLLGTLGHVAEAAPPAPGSPSLDLRYRYEVVDDDAITYSARASTLRAAVGYETRSFHGFSAVGRFAAARALGHDFYRVPSSPTQDNRAYPMVIDPSGVVVEEAYGQYEGSWLTLRLGRQELAFNDSRFLGSSSWNQLHQTFDAASVVVRPVEGLTLHCALTGRVNRVTGPDARDGQLYLLGHLANATYTRPGLGTLAAYDLHLDYPSDLSSSTNTLGVRLEGPLRLDDDWSILYATEAAHETDAADNPDDIAASYYLVEAGAAFRGISGTLGFNVREGDGPVDRLSTPLSHPWDGWAEKFADTPPAGLRTLTIAFAGEVPMVRELRFSSTYRDYWAQSASTHYGREVDVGAEYRLLAIDARWTAGGRAAFYQADRLFADTVRLSIYTAYDF